jgi:hypothetical protein
LINHVFSLDSTGSSSSMVGRQTTISNYNVSVLEDEWKKENYVEDKMKESTVHAT